MLIWIAVANVVLWTGLFLILLFALMRGQNDIDSRLDQMESRLKRGLRK
jgi:hypothetical protein